MIRRIERDSGVRYQVYGRRNGKQVYVGTYESQTEAETAELQYKNASKCVVGDIADFKICAVRPDGSEVPIFIERALKDCDGIQLEFVVDGVAYGIWIHKFKEGEGASEVTALHSPMEAVF